MAPWVAFESKQSHLLAKFETFTPSLKEKSVQTCFGMTGPPSSCSLLKIVLGRDVESLCKTKPRCQDYTTFLKQETAVTRFQE